MTNKIMLDRIFVSSCLKTGFSHDQIFNPHISLACFLSFTHIFFWVFYPWVSFFWGFTRLFIGRSRFLAFLCWKMLTNFRFIRLLLFFVSF